MFLASYDVIHMVILHINMLCSRWMFGTVETLAGGGREGSWAEEGS